MVSIRFRSPALLAVLILSALLAPPLSAQTPRWTPLGPFGGTISNLALHPTDPRVVYAASLQGVFRSTDAGASWQLVLSWTEPGFVALDPTRPTTVYASQYLSPPKIFKSTDGGSHWVVVSRNLSPDLLGVLPLAVDPSRPARLYLGTEIQGLLRSTDGGVTWEAVNQGLADGGNTAITALAASRRPFGTAFAGTSNGGLYRTVNGGDSWSPLRQGLPDTGVQALAVSPSTPRTVYASFTGSGIYRSTDAGASWTPAGDPAPPGIPVSALAVHPSSPLVVYAGTRRGGVFKTTDGGVHWTATALARTVEVRALAVGSSPSEVLYAGAEAPNQYHLGTDPGGVLRSADGGASWTRINRGITGLGALSVAVDPADPEALVVGLMGPGLFRTVNRGANWVRTGVGFPATRNFGVIIPQVLATAPGVFYAVDSRQELLWKSTDSGRTWSSLPGPRSLAFLRADPLEPDTLYALFDTGVQRSVDGGASWVPLTTGPLGLLCIISDLAVSRASASQPPVFYAVGARPSVSGTCSIFNQVGVFRNAGGAASWSAVYAGLPELAGREAGSVAVDPRDPRTVYVGMGRSFFGVHEGVWKSTDSGATWRQVGLNGQAVQALALSPIPGVIWAATSGQVFRSGNAGATWRDQSGGLRLSFGGFVFDPDDPRRVYGAGSGGVWVFEAP